MLCGFSKTIGSFLEKVVGRFRKSKHLEQVAKMRGGCLRKNRGEPRSATR